MLRFVREGDATKFGFNFYPLEDEHSAGFRLRLWAFNFRVRYRKKFGDWVFKNRWYGKKQLEASKAEFRAGFPSHQQEEAERQIKLLYRE